MVKNKEKWDGELSHLLFVVEQHCFRVHCFFWILFQILILDLVSDSDFGYVSDSDFGSCFRFWFRILFGSCFRKLADILVSDFFLKKNSKHLRHEQQQTKNLNNKRPVSSYSKHVEFLATSHRKKNHFSPNWNCSLSINRMEAGAHLWNNHSKQHCNNNFTRPLIMILTVCCSSVEWRLPHTSDTSPDNDINCSLFISRMEAGAHLGHFSW